MKCAMKYDMIPLFYKMRNEICQMINLFYDMYNEILHDSSLL